MRDDLDSLPIPRSAKRYNRLSGLRGASAPRKFDAYAKMVGDLVNGGETRGFKNHDVGVQETAQRVVDALIHA